VLKHPDHLFNGIMYKGFGFRKDMAHPASKAPNESQNIHKLEAKDSLTTFLPHTAEYTAVHPRPHSTFCSNSTILPFTRTFCLGVI
jgi:hypothetical protein